MASIPIRGGRQGTNSPSSRRTSPTSESITTSLICQLDGAHASSPSYDAAKRRSLSRSVTTVTSFLSKLRPSKRPERGGTARPTRGETAMREHESGPAAASPGIPEQSCGRKRAKSLDRHGANAAVLPRRAHSTGNRMMAGHHPAGSRLPPSNAANNDEKRRIPPPRPNAHAHPRRPVPQKPPTTTTSTATSPLLPSSPLLPNNNNSLSTSSNLSNLGSRELFLAKRALRRQRRALQESGDFLGVTGVNPYTGEMDVLTPTTTATTTAAASGSAITSSPALTFATTTNTNSSSSSSRGGQQAAYERELVTRMRREKEEDDEMVVLRREEEKAEKRKDALREVLARQGVRWRKGEDGWSSVGVAEPPPRGLSPIPGSVSGSSSSSSARKSQSVEGGTPQQPVVIPERTDSFLGMAAVVAREVESHRRRCLIMRGDAEMALVQRQQPGQPSLERVEEEGKVLGGGVSLLREAMARFMLPPAIPRGEGSLPQDASRLLEYHPDWEVGDLIVVPTDLRRLSENSRVGDLAMGRVMELDESVPTEQWGGRLIQDRDSLNKWNSSSHADMILQVNLPAASGSGLGQAYPSACTRTTTTTGSEHLPPRYRIDARPSDATLDGSRNARLIRRLSTGTALSQPASLPSSTTTPSSVCSGQPDSPGGMQLSVWRSINNPGPETGMTTPTLAQEKTDGTNPLDSNNNAPIPPPPPKPEPESEPGSATAWSSTTTTTQKTATPTKKEEREEEKQTTAPPKKRTAAAAAAAEGNGPPQQQPPPPPDREMPKTLRKPPHSSGNEAAGTRKSSPTCTRTSTYLMTLPAAGSAAAAEEEANLVRGAARTAFAALNHRHPLTTTITRLLGGSDPVVGSHPLPRRAGGRGQGQGAAKKKGKGTGEKQQQQQQQQGGSKGVEQKGKEGGQQQQKKKNKKGKDEDSEQPAAAAEKGKDKSNSSNAKGGGDNNNSSSSSGSLSLKLISRWARMAAVTLERVVAAYWQVVSPVFDGGSELRKRVDSAQATGGDLVVCVLAAVFVVLVLSAGAWAARAAVWIASVLGEVWGVMRVVAGL